MSAYAIFQINVTNKNEYEEYVKLAPSIVKKYQGEYIVRGGKLEVLLGKWDHPRTVIVKFPNYETATKWYHSEEYFEIKKIREENSEGNCIIVNGV